MRGTGETATRPRARRRHHHATKRPLSVRASMCIARGIPAAPSLSHALEAPHHMQDDITKHARQAKPPPRTVAFALAFALAELDGSGVDAPGPRLAAQPDFLVVATLVLPEALARHEA